MELNTAESSQGYPSSITSPRREQRVVYVVNRNFRNWGRRRVREKTIIGGRVEEVVQRSWKDILELLHQGQVCFGKNFRRKFHYPAT